MTWEMAEEWRELAARHHAHAAQSVGQTRQLLLALTKEAQRAADDLSGVKVTAQSSSQPENADRAA